jgi:hypothetical protein
MHEYFNENTFVSHCDICTINIITMKLVILILMSKYEVNIPYYNKKVYLTTFLISYESTELEN